MQTLTRILDGLLTENSPAQWLAAVGVAIVAVLLIFLIRGIANRRYQKFLQTPEVELLEVPMHVIARTTALFIVVLGAFIALSFLQTTHKVDRIAQTIMTVVACWQAGVWASTAAIAWIETRRRRTIETDRASAGSYSIIALITRAVIWAVVALLTLDNLGVNVTTLVAGLGVGGIAVALAVQNVLGDLLASLTITLDKPFVIGDFLVIGDFMGAVEYIGIKSTRLRSLGGEQIVMSNGDLLNGRVRNYGRMQERRVVFTVGVVYETPRVKLQQIPARIRSIIEAQQQTRFDRCHLARFNNFSIDYECVFYVLSSDYNKYMDIQQEINLQIHQVFEDMGVEFAYPTQKLFVAQVT